MNGYNSSQMGFFQVVIKIFQVTIPRCIYGICGLMVVLKLVYIQFSVHLEKGNMHY